MIWYILLPICKSKMPFSWSKKKLPFLNWYKVFRVISLNPGICLLSVPLWTTHGIDLLLWFLVALVREPQEWEYKLRGEHKLLWWSESRENDCSTTVHVLAPLSLDFPQLFTCGLFYPEPGLFLWSLHRKWLQGSTEHSPRLEGIKRRVTLFQFHKVPIVLIFIFF